MNNENRGAMSGMAGILALMLLALGGCSQPPSSGPAQVSTGADPG